MNSKTFLVAVALVATTVTTYAQADKSQRPSPPATATGKVGDATITINYSSPAVKGRTIFGGTIPYDSVWRAGANEATVFETDKAVIVEGKALPAGKYSLFVRPGKDSWQFIFNSQTGQWGVKRGGVANRDAANDVLTVSVKPKTAAEMNERLMYEVTASGFVLKWEKAEAQVMVK